MADNPIMIFDPATPGMLTGQDTDTDLAYSVRRVDLRKGAKVQYDTIGLDAPFEQIYAGIDMSETFTVDGLQIFSTVNSIYNEFELDVVDNGGVSSTGVYNHTQVRVRQANPEYVDVFGSSSRVSRNFKDGTDIATQNVWMAGSYAAVQQDAENTSHTHTMIAFAALTKLENGSSDYVCGFNSQGQNGNAAGRTINCTKMVQTVGSDSYTVGRAGQTITIGEFVQLDLPVASFLGTVNITEHYGVKQMDPNGKNVFEGPVELRNVELFLNNLPTTQPAGANQVWRDGDFLKITPNV